MLRIVSWNINHRDEPWHELVNSNFDVALVQEARPPPPEIASLVEVDQSLPWCTAGGPRPWRTAVVRLSDRVAIRTRTLRSVGDTQPGDLAVSRMGTLAVADIATVSADEVITVVSIYGAWEGPVGDIGGRWIYADASVHRLISDLSALIGRQQGHKIIAAGDLNILYGYGEDGSTYWKARYDSVFARMESLGLMFVGPQAPDGGEQANPWPDELPKDSQNVPTFRFRIQQPETARRQLDFVFASESLRKRLRVQALNRPEEWGPSDHCRIAIEVGDTF
jgi:hypothetical protein